MIPRQETLATGTTRRACITGAAAAAMLALFGIKGEAALPYGVVNVAVADVRGSPSRESTLETQALLGMPVAIQRDLGEWLDILVLPQRYPGFLRRDDIVPVSRLESYIGDGSVVTVTGREAAIRREPDEGSPIILRAYASTRLPCLGSEDGWYRVKLPDGRRGHLQEALRFPSIAAIPKRPIGDIITLAEHVVDTYDTPYRWGGTTPDGWDCSGFMLWLFRANGHDIPRDAWQQYARRVGVAYNADAAPPNDGVIRRLEGLRPGDLAFFGDRQGAGRVTHVGIIGSAGHVLHASSGTLRATGDCLDRSRFHEDRVFGDHLGETFIGGRRYL